MPDRNEFIGLFIADHPDYRLGDTLTLQCPKHGPYTSVQLFQIFPDGTEMAVPSLGCPFCANEADRQSIIDNWGKGISSSAIASIGIPGKFATCTLKGFSIQDANPEYARLKANAREKCLAFIRNEIRSVVLLGTTGLGKTHLMAACLKGCVTSDHGKTALYVVERKIYRDIHESYLGRKDLPTEGQVIARYSNVDVLGIDEIGRTSWTDHEAQILYEIIDNRDADNRKTIMAGNLLPHDFNAKFDDSFRRKLGACQVDCRWARWEPPQNNS
jgi:DNA replication protein DnaC